MHDLDYEFLEAQFLVPDWGDEVDYGIGLCCRTGPPGYKGWRDGTTTLCKSRLYPPVWD
jgi:hypothetical protein